MSPNWSALDAKSPEFGQQVDAITNMGRKEIAAASSMSNRFLDRPVRAMDQDSGVGANLTELRRTVEDLDPGRRGKITGRKLFGIIPFGNKLKNYFDSYTSAQGHIQAILARLASGKDELLMDNAAIDVERQKLWEAMGNLEQMIHIAKTLDTKLEEKAADLDATDPEKAKALRETALFYVRQRTQDLLTQMAVSVQGYLALDLVKKNNVELVKGVDRASTTTVGALRTAVTVAQAMTNQRLVLGQITAAQPRPPPGLSIRPGSCCATTPPRFTSKRHRAPFRSRRCNARSRTSTRPWTRWTSSRSGRCSL